MTAQFNSLCRRVLVLSLVGLLALSSFWLLPAKAFAAPEDEVDTVNITVEYRYLAGQQVQIPQSINQYDREYRLISQAEPVKEGSLPITRTYKYRIDGALSGEALEQAKALPGVVINPVEVVLERRVDKTTVAKNLPNNDIEYLKRSEQFEVASATSPNALTQKELDLAGVSYRVQEVDRFDIPKFYEATIVYRGTETYAEIAYYSAEATYTTQTVEGSVDSFVVLAVYEPVETGAASGDGSSGAGALAAVAGTGGSQDNASSGGSTANISDDAVPLSGVNQNDDPLSLVINPVLIWTLLAILAVVILIFFLIMRSKDKQTNRAQAQYLGKHSRPIAG